MKGIHWYSCILGLPALLAAAGCIRPERAPASEPPGAVVPKDKPVAAKAPQPAVAEPAPTTGVTAAPADVPPAKAPAEARKAPAEPAPKKETKAPPPRTPGAAPLDLAALEKRLKDTDAIGVFTKLTLKNQVDDLLGRFEAHHDGTNKASLADLRQPFDLLIIKVLSLLQDRDAALAGAIATSREAMWAILSDPARFRSFLNQNRG